MVDLVLLKGVYVCAGMVISTQQRERKGRHGEYLLLAMDATARNTIATRTVKRNLAKNAIAIVVLVIERVKCSFWSWADTWRHRYQ